MHSRANTTLIKTLQHFFFFNHFWHLHIGLLQAQTVAENISSIDFVLMIRELFTPNTNTQFFSMHFNVFNLLKCFAGSILLLLLQLHKLLFILQQQKNKIYFSFISLISMKESFFPFSQRVCFIFIYSCFRHDAVISIYYELTQLKVFIFLLVYSVKIWLELPSFKSIQRSLKKKFFSLVNIADILT